MNIPAVKLINNWPVVGHDWAVKQLQLALVRDEVPHALLFTGPESVGKMTLACILTAALLCRGQETERPCGVCLSCRKLDSGNHPDFMLVAPEAPGGNLKIDQIRAVERFLALTPNESARKIALIDGFERATIGAANALLKTLEEPPAYAHLFLLAQDADLLLPTIVSRSQHLALRPLSRGVVEEALAQRWQVPSEQAGYLARISGGRMGWAVRAATDPDYQERMSAALAMLIELLRQDLPLRFEVAQTLARDADIELDEVLAYWLTGWRDVLLVQTENGDDLTYVHHREALSGIARNVSLNDTIAAIKALERCREALQRNANTQLQVENLLLNLPTL